MTASHPVHSSLPGASVTEGRTALLKRAARNAMDYLEGVDARPVAPTPEAIAALAAATGANQRRGGVAFVA